MEIAPRTFWVNELDYQIGDPPPPANYGNTGNIHHFALIKRIADTLKRRGWKDIRIEQQQVGGGVVKGLNKPDIQAIDKLGRRVVVEVDTNRAQSKMHQYQVKNADPRVRALFVLIDPRTGVVKQRTIYNPKNQSWVDRTGPLPVREGHTILGELAAEAVTMEMETLVSF